jgi:hypothetical protein
MFRRLTTPVPAPPGYSRRRWRPEAGGATGIFIAGRFPTLAQDFYFLQMREEHLPPLFLFRFVQRTARRRLISPLHGLTVGRLGASPVTRQRVLLALRFGLNLRIRRRSALLDPLVNELADSLRDASYRRVAHKSQQITVR